MDGPLGIHGRLLLVGRGLFDGAAYPAKGRVNVGDEAGEFADRNRIVADISSDHIGGKLDQHVAVPRSGVRSIHQQMPLMCCGKIIARADYRERQVSHVTTIRIAAC